MSSIFEKSRKVTPSQMIAVAERRFADAQALCETGKNAHANGARYLCGFVIEILLKAQLLRKYSATIKQRSGKKGSRESVSEKDRNVWSLIHRSHELGEMLDELGECSRIERGVEMKSNGIPSNIKKVVRVLKTKFDAKVDVERVQGAPSSPERFRIAVSSAGFNGMPHLDRQDRIWEIVDEVLDRGETNLISMILAFAPAELETTAK